VKKDKVDWTRTPDALLYSGELLLPFFGIKVTRSAPRSEIFPVGTGNEELTTDSGDAFSISYLGRKPDATTVDRRFIGLDPGYIRRVLLRVLDGEEYDDVLGHYNVRNRWEVAPGVPKEKRHTVRAWRKVEDPDPKAQVRITDLRLAKDLRPLDLKRELNAEVSGLRLPLTTDDALRWKWKTLRQPKSKRTLSDLRDKKEWYEEECLRIKAISFAAAALCLSVDLGLKDLEESSHNDLTKVILSWHRLISDLISALDKAVGEASGLLAARKGTEGGRPPDPEFKFYTALVRYRMGYSPADIARRIGISAPNSHEWRETGTADEYLKVNKNWKNQLSEKLKRGIEIEQEKFPSAAEVFSRRDEKEVREAALSAYANYDDHYPREPENISVALEDGRDLLGMPANETVQKKIALIQLGYCIKWGLDPLSPKLG
jgi:hypothetical protein